MLTEVNILFGLGTSLYYIIADISNLGYARRIEILTLIECLISQRTVCCLAITESIIKQNVLNIRKLYCCLHGPFKVRVQAWLVSFC